MLEKRHYKALCEALYEYWCSTGVDLHLGVGAALSDYFHNFSTQQWDKYWTELMEEDCDELPSE